jgi:hypothetical protein
MSSEKKQQRQQQHCINIATNIVSISIVFSLKKKINNTSEYHIINGQGTQILKTVGSIASSEQ